MKKRIKLLSALIVMSLLLGVAAVPSHAVSPDSLKFGNIKWDLKNKKARKYKTQLIFINSKGKVASHYKTGKVTIKNFKSKNSGSNKVVTFTVAYNLPSSFSKKDIDGYVKAEARGLGIGDYFYVTIADYQTGLSLESNTDPAVKVKISKLKRSGLKKFKGTKGRWYKFYTKASRKVSVTYPRTNKNLCILAGGYPNAVSDDKEFGPEAFYDGQIPFNKSSIYSKKIKNTSHGMRLK